MSTFHSIDLDALRALPPADRYKQLREIRRAMEETLAPESRRAAAEVLAEERHTRKTGAPTRTAERLGISHQRLAEITSKEP